MVPAQTLITLDAVLLNFILCFFNFAFFLSKTFSDLAQKHNSLYPKKTG